MSLALSWVRHRHLISTLIQMNPFSPPPQYQTGQGKHKGLERVQNDRVGEWSDTLGSRPAAGGIMFLREVLKQGL